MTPNMNLPVPAVGVTSGPQYATDLNSCLSLLDAHNHTPGAGVAIPTAGLSINEDLSIGSNNLDDVLSVRFTSQAAVLSGSGDVSCVYAVLGDLYYNNSAGTAIRITQSGAVVGTPGSITNLVAPASATYVPLTGKFVWQSGVNTPADMDFGSAILRNDVASGFGLTLTPPTLTTDYQLTLPLLPASTKIMALSASGVMSAPYTVDNSTIEIASNVIQLKDGGTPNAKLANMPALTVKANATNASAAPQDLAATNNTVLRSQSGVLDFGQVTSALIANGAVGTSALATGAVTQPKLGGSNYGFTSVTSGSRSGTGATVIASGSLTVLGSGRLVEVGLQNNGLGGFEFDNSASPAAQMVIAFIVNGSTVAQFDCGSLAAGAIQHIKLPASAFNMKLALSPGAVTYSIEAQVSGGGIIDWTNIQSYIREV